MYTYELDGLMEMVLDEGFGKQLMMGLDPRNRQDLVTTFKNHSNEKFLRAVRTCKKKDDLEYLRKDANIGISQFKKILVKMKKCIELGECEETKNYYKGIKKMYLDKGVTVKDVEATIKWFETDCRKAISDRMKEVSN